MTITNNKLPPHYWQELYFGFYVRVDQEKDNFEIDDAGVELVDMEEYFHDCGLPFILMLLRWLAFVYEFSFVAVLCM